MGAVFTVASYNWFSRYHIRIYKNENVFGLFHESYLLSKFRNQAHLKVLLSCDNLVSFKYSVVS